MGRVAYWSEFKAAAIDKGFAAELPEFDAIEVLTKEPVIIEVRWKEKRRRKARGAPERIEWRERWGTVIHTPGQVFHRRWRDATEWEAEDWAHLSQRELDELGVTRMQTGFRVEYVRRIKDLPAAIRQQTRHIVSSLIAREYDEFIIEGDAVVLGIQARSIVDAVRDLVMPSAPAPEQLQQAIEALTRLASDLERARTPLKQEARAKLLFAQRPAFWSVAVDAHQAATLLLQKRAEDYEMALYALGLGQKWLRLMQQITRRFRDCYTRLGQLAVQLQELADQGVSDSQQFLAIANEALGIYRHLEREVPKFNPYYEHLQDYRFQRLGSAVKHAEAGSIDTLQNDIREALAKIELFVRGESPTQAEVARTQRSFL